MPFDSTTSEVSNVGSTIGDEMKKQGLYSAVLSVIGILLYLAFRFDLYSALGVVIAVVHDLFITLGFISLTGIEFDTTVLAAILTLLGYSVNDSIVIFDSNILCILILRAVKYWMFCSLSSCISRDLL